jgi:hypothetical protein
MPESNTAAKKRVQKANRALGIGDEQGRIPVRVKEPPKIARCTVCQMELKITKTNTELTAHADSKHNSTMPICFPGAKEIADEMIAVLARKDKGPGAASAVAAAASSSTTGTKKTKAGAAGGMDDLLAAGLSSAGKGAGGKKK